MNIPFTKVEASANDFIILDNREKKLEKKIPDFESFARLACKRKRSVGADGLLVLEDSPSADFKMRVINPDGSEVAMCGNGIRSSALYAFRKEWCGPFVKIATDAGILEAEISGESIKVKMTLPEDIKLDQNIGVGKSIMTIHAVNTGVRPAVHFEERVVKDASTILGRTYERGVEDETLACGTGVVAAAIISNLVKGTKEPVSVVTGSGDTLKVYFKKEHSVFRNVYLEGKAHIIFDGGLNYV